MMNNGIQQNIVQNKEEKCSYSNSKIDVESSSSSDGCMTQEEVSLLQQRLLEKERASCNENYCIIYGLGYLKKVDIYPYKLQMRKPVYDEESKEYKMLKVDVDISEVPEDKREETLRTQKQLQQALKDFRSGKIPCMSMGLFND